MKKIKIVITIPLITALSLLLSACQAQGGQNTGFFNHFFVTPFALAIHGVAVFFNGSFGMAIILITVTIRLILMPLMLKQYKNQSMMKEKMELLKPEMDKIQKKLKAAKKPQEQQKLQQEMFSLYKTNGVNPLNAGCLPILIQMPILMGFYYAIRGNEEIASHSFLWFNLGHSDIWITVIAGIVYFLQYKVTLANMSPQPPKQMQFMGILSPLMIVLVSLNAPAALPLYWTMGGLFLIFQSWLGRKLFMKEKVRPIQANTDS
ncbi:membrane protein insertase YidC [Cytobacillus oceanisediminis]|uniref:Membrane protein insertase YidC n=1 Tax=Cytobacillus oceanisediminis TaxID=665099 RepID=A0A562JTZ8_9BACI|nr:membrane protein insertase YidC [Cytobacillus oceanisediminis]TWH86473.1 YidC/Oxa1 family membrane protein insertase [Cytobacillus oceanisediminis]